MFMSYYGTLHENQAIYLKNYILKEIEEHLLEKTKINILSLGYGEGKFEEYLLEEIKKKFPEKEVNYNGIEIGDKLKNEIIFTNQTKERVQEEIYPRILKNNFIEKIRKNKIVYDIYLLIAPSIDFLFPLKKIDDNSLFDTREKISESRIKSLNLKYEFKMKGYDLQTPNYDNYISLINCLLASYYLNEKTLYYEVCHTGDFVRVNGKIPFSTVKSYTDVESDSIFNLDNAFDKYLLPMCQTVIQKN